MAMPTMIEIERWRSEKSPHPAANGGPLTWPCRGHVADPAVMRALPAAGRGGRMAGTRARGSGRRTRAPGPSANRPNAAALTSTKPMMNPPSAAPAMLPMPPRTAAVNALRPAWKPRLNWIVPKYRPWTTPAAPASADADEERQRDRAVDVHAHQLRRRHGPGRSTRIARPSRVRLTNSWSAIISDHRDDDHEDVDRADADAADLDPRRWRDHLRGVRSATGRR